MTRTVKRATVRARGGVADLARTLSQKIDNGDIPADAIVVSAEAELHETSTITDGWVIAGSDVVIVLEWPA